jgi:hypothetical protein
MEVGITNFAANTESWGDYDNDGYLDLLANGSEGSRVYRNNGDGTFSLALNVPQGAYVPPGWGDFDNDGDLDFLVGANGATHVYRNDGAGMFTEVETGLPSIGSPDLVDADADGFLDLRTYGYYYSNGIPYSLTYLYHNNGNLTFTALSPTTSTGLPPTVPMLGDFDIDGRADLLRVDSVGGNFAHVYLGDATHSFTNLAYEAAVPSVNRWVWGDGDGDGDLDFFVSDGFFLGGAGFECLGIVPQQ